MSAFLVLHDPMPDSRPTRAGDPPRVDPHHLDPHLLGSHTLAAAVVRVTAVPDGVQLRFAPPDGVATVDALVTALARVVDRTRREGSFLRFAVEVALDGAAVSLTITGPPVLAGRATRARQGPRARQVPESDGVARTA